MVRRPAKKSVSAEPRDAPVGLRLGDLRREVESRLSPEVAPGAIVKRDIGRYYMLLDEARETLSFSLSEAEALVSALGSQHDAVAARYIWAELEKQYRGKAQDPDGPYWYLPSDFDPLPFVSKLSQLSIAQNMAILDAVERYWVLADIKYPEEFPLEAMRDLDLLVQVGLVSAARMAFDVREREVKAEQQGEPGRVIDLVEAMRASLERKYRASGDPALARRQAVGRLG